MIHIRTSKRLLLCSLLLISGSLFGQENNVSLLFVGDVMQHDGQIAAAYNTTTKSYCYDDGFKFIKPIIQKYDIRVANLEATHAGKPYKGYPRFSAPDELSQSIVNAGFNVILTANNHSCDGGKLGITRTLDVLDELGVKHTGTFRSKEERDSLYPLMMEQNGVKVAILNYTYGTNGLSVDAPLIVNYIDSNVIKEDIRRAKELHADYIVCTMHWGTEYEPLPSNYQKKYEDVCYRYGVDMVIGGHPHVIQPVQINEEHDDHLTAWSLGNFVSNQRARYKNGGMMLHTTIEKKDNVTKLIDAGYYLFYVHVKDEGAIKPYYLLPEYDYLHYRSDFINSSDKAKMDQFFSDSRALMKEHTSASVKESIVSEDLALNNDYAQILTEYYGIGIDGASASLLMNSYIGQNFTKTVDRTGKEHIIYGRTGDVADLDDFMVFLKDCGFVQNLYPVMVKPGDIMILER